MSSLLSPGTPGTPGTPRTAGLPALLALLVLLLLGGALAATITVTTPWHPLPSSGPATVSAATDFTHDEIVRARGFYSALRPLSYGSLAVGLLVLLLLGLTPLGGRLVARVARPYGQARRGHWVWQVVVGAVAVSLIHRLVLLPFSARAEVVLRQYGLSTQSWAGWAIDVAKGFGLETGLLVLAFLGLYGLIRLAPRLWWVPACVGGFVLVVAVSFVYPVVVEPVFNSFRPMSQGELRAELMALAERDGVPVQRVLVADASRRTTAVNAYVSGFGSTRRIVVYDTLLKTSGPREVKLIVAHELGHADRRDVLYGTLVGALGVAAGVCLLYLLLTRPSLQRRAGVSSARDPRSLALVLLIFTGLSTLSMPVQNLISRQIEARADVHALNLTEDPAAYARMQRQLAVHNLAPLQPGPVPYYLYATHPTPPQRITLSREWARTHGVPVPPPLKPSR